MNTLSSYIDNQYFFNTLYPKYINFYNKYQIDLLENFILVNSNNTKIDLKQHGGSTYKTNIDGILYTFDYFYKFIQVKNLWFLT